MGGCSSKPKVLNGDENDAPKSPPEENEKEKDAVEAAVEKEVVKGQDGVDADENGSKSRSLGNLFVENEEGKYSSQNEIVKESDVPEVKPTETVKPEEEKVVAPLVDAPAEDESQEVKTSQSETVKESDVPEVKPKEAETVKYEEEKVSASGVDAPAEDELQEVKTSQSETVKESDVPKVTPKKDERVKFEEEKIAPLAVDAPAEDKSEVVKPAVEAENGETSEMEPEGKNETQEDKKQEECKETEKTEN